MHCETAIRMVRDLKKSSGIPSPDHQSLRMVVHEINQLNTLLQEAKSQLSEDKKGNNGELAGILLHYRAVLFNKRCALAYLNERIKRIEKCWWEIGSIPAETQECLFEFEKEFIQKYDKLIEEYMRSEDVELNMDMNPPTGLFVECRVLKNAGKIMTDSGVFNLEENTTVLMKRKDAELLIRQGILQPIS
jgi:hypothetical protein